MTHRTTVIRDDEEVPVTAELSYHRFCPGSTDGRFGPKLEPDEPAGFEYEGAETDDGESIELTDSEIQDICSELESDRRNYDGD